MKLIARCRRCGRGFVWIGTASDLTDHYPPPDWRPEGGWGRWRGMKDPRYPPPECGGTLELLTEAIPHARSV